jgi:integrase
VKLDAKTVAALRLDGRKDLIVFDDMAGFGYRLRLGAGGKVLRSWVVQYRRAGGTRRITLGPAEVLSAEQARLAAKKILGRVALGEDPQGDRIDRRGKDRLTLGAVVDQYLAIKQGEVVAHTFAGMARYLGYFKPLHNMPIDVVSRKDVASRLLAIKRDHTSVVTSRARRALSAFFAWAMREGLCEANPVVGTNKPPENKPRERVLSDEELVAVWNACGDDDHGRIVRLLILLGSRRAEVGGMCFSEFDFDAGTWTLPAERSKNGRKHTLPLPPAALAIVRAVPQMVSRDQLFGVRSAAGFSAWGLRKAELDARCGFADFTLHDLRRSVATKMADIGVQPHVIEAVLNHYSGHRAGIAGIYNRSTYDREVRNALALWADHVRTLVEGGERKVLPFPP